MCAVLCSRLTKSAGFSKGSHDPPRTLLCLRWLWRDAPSMGIPATQTCWHRRVRFLFSALTVLLHVYAFQRVKPLLPEVASMEQPNNRVVEEGNEYRGEQVGDLDFRFNQHIQPDAYDQQTAYGAHFLYNNIA